MADMTGADRTQELRKGAVGFGGVLLQSITFMAPAIATAFSMPAGIAFSGGGAPLSVVFALVASLLAAVSIGQLSKHMPTAGSFYTYVSNGIHPALGFLVGWGFLLGILVGGPFLALQMGFVVAGTTNAEWGWSADLWWVWTVLVCLLVFVLGYRGIKASTGTGVLLGAFEILLNVACIFYFLRHRREEFSWWLHGLIPVLGALAFIPAFCAGAGIPVFSFISPLPEPLSYAGPAAAIWMVIGIAYLVVLVLRRPDRITETRRVFADE